MAFPVNNSTKPFWRSQLHELDDHRSTDQLPDNADVVVIGSGYAGASIVHHLLEGSQRNGRNLSIVILEAREACSGATGRNGGHLKPDPYYRAAVAAEKYGAEAAEEVASFEARQIGEIKKLVEREDIDCDFVQTRAADVCLYDEGNMKLKAGLDKLAKLGISTIPDVHYSRGRAAEGVSGVKGAVGCFTYSAAHVWPYKLVLWLLENAVKAGVNLQTHTPVQNVLPSQNGSDKWTVKTPRGSICAGKVVFATNGYTSRLLPEFKSKIVPVRGLCCRIRTPNERPPLLTNSYILRFNDWEYDYLIPRSDGSIVVGGARRDFVRDLKQWFDVIDDSRLMEPAKTYFDGYMQRTFHGWENSSAFTDQIWTGIMGYSSDDMPHVGKVPGKPGQFICGGFSGHGMPQIFLSAKAVAEMIAEGKEVEDVDLPRLYRASQERLDAKGNVHLEAWRAIPQEIGPRL